MEKKFDYNMEVLKRWMPTGQWQAVKELAKGPEGEFFQKKAAELVDIINHKMPKPYESEGKEDGEVMVYLHYFRGGWDWWITEQPLAVLEDQAFGLVRGFETELGYIMIPELTTVGAELDLHWEIKSLKEVKESLN
jgi:hypothetical protein